MAELVRIESTGWRRGLGAVLRAELSAWWGTRRWVMQLLIWVLMIDGILLAVLLGSRGEQGGPGAQELFLLYGVFSGLFVAVGVVIAMQGSVVGERRSGTAQWVLSGPVSRTSFILANSLGFLVLATLVPGLVAYAFFRWIGGLDVDALRFLSGGAIIYLHTWFYLTLTLLTSTIFRHWAPAAGVPFGVLAAQNIVVSMFPRASGYIPWAIAIQDRGGPAVAAVAMAGGAELNVAALVITGAASLLFLVTALAVFQHDEL